MSSAKERGIQIYEQWLAGKSIATLAREFGHQRPTIERHLRDTAHLYQKACQVAKEERENLHQAAIRKAYHAHVRQFGQEIAARWKHDYDESIQAINAKMDRIPGVALCVYDQDGLLLDAVRAE